MTDIEAPAIPAAAVRPATASPAGEILRDIARAGLAGIAVGTVVGGIGGRLVMRLAAVLVPTSDGIPTENGNVIGAITVEGTLALILFGGVLSGVLAAAVWVIVRPWLPADPTWRLVVATAAAIGLGMPGLIEGDNVDFLFLRHDPVVVGSLVVLLGLFGPAMLAVDGWLDRRLARASGRDAATALYAAMAVIGSCWRSRSSYRSTCRRVCGRSASRSSWSAWQPSGRGSPGCAAANRHRRCSAPVERCSRPRS